MTTDTPVKPSGKRWSVGTLTYTTSGLVVLFCWLLWGDFAWSLKDRSVPSVVQLLLNKYQASDLLSGLLIGSLPAAFTMILGPIISYQSDRHRGRWGRRIPFLLIPTPVIVLSMVGLAFCPQLGTALHHGLGAWSPGFHASILILFAVFWTLFEFASVTANSVFSGLVNDVVPAPVLGRFYGMFRALSLIAGIVFNYQMMGKVETHFAWIFLGMGALYGVGFTMMCLKVKEGSYPAPPPPSLPRLNGSGFLSAAKDYFKECFGHSYYVWYFVVMAVSWAMMHPINLFSVYFAKSVAMSMDTYGKCLALTFALSLLISYPLGVLADRLHPLRLSLGVQGLYFVASLLGGIFARDAFTFGVFYVITGVLGGTWITAVASLGQRLFPRSKFAQLGSAAGLVGCALSISVGPLVGVFLDHASHIYRYTYFMSSGLALLGFLGGLVVHAKFMALGGPKHYVAPEV
ncbi:MAG: MFS transporter [Chthoniobacteraceae bacterium]